MTECEFIYRNYWVHNSFLVIRTFVKYRRLKVRMLIRAGPWYFLKLRRRPQDVKYPKT
jgi:hypothetical protein